LSWDQASNVIAPTVAYFIDEDFQTSGVVIILVDPYHQVGDDRKYFNDHLFCQQHD
jgi:hypothetical protein